MVRIPRLPSSPEPCPPHEWEEVEDIDSYMLRCAKHPDHIWPDPRERRD